MAKWFKAWNKDYVNLDKVDYVNIYQNVEKEWIVNACFLGNSYKDHDWILGIFKTEEDAKIFCLTLLIRNE